MKDRPKIDLGMTGYDELFMNDQERADNEAFGLHLALLAIERIFLQKISYLMSSTGYHFDIQILASTCC